MIQKVFQQVLQAHYKHSLPLHHKSLKIPINRKFYLIEWNLSQFLNNIVLFSNRHTTEWSTEVIAKTAFKVSWDKRILRPRNGEGNGNPLQYSCLENPMDREPGRLQPMGLLGVRDDWVTSLSLFTLMHWRRKSQPIPVFLPGEPQGWGSLVGCRLWGGRVGHDWSDLAAAAAGLERFVPALSV